MDIDGLATADEGSHQTEVLTPLLLAALASGRVAALPELACGATPWASKAWAAAPMRRPASAPYHFGACRSGACNFNMIATGAASPELDAEEGELAAAFGYTLPFDQAETDAEALSRAPLRCVPMGGASGLTGGYVRALDAPAWRRYRQLLGNASHAPLAATLDGLGPKTTHAELARRLSALEQHHVVYLPRRRSRVFQVPPPAQRACGDACKMASEEYDIEGVTTLEGYCEETKTGDAGDCRAGRKGSWRLGDAKGFNSVRACLSRCMRSCARCRFVSVSMQERDCSWYANGACNIDRLHQSGLGHRTYVINTSMMTGGLVRRA